MKFIAPPALLCLTLCVVCALPTLGRAAELKAAVLDLGNRAAPKLNDDAARFLTDIIREVVRDGMPSNLVDLMTRENLNVLLAAQNISLEQCYARSQCEVELGKNLGADWVVSGEVLLYDDVLKVVLKLHKTGSGTLLGTWSGEGDNLKGLERAVRQRADDVREALRRDLYARTVEVLEETSGFISLDTPVDNVALYSEDQSSPRGIFNPSKNIRTLKLPPGKHDLRFELPGHEPCLHPGVTITKGLTVAVSCTFLPVRGVKPSTTAVLYLRSEPDGARIFLGEDENDTGQATPATLKNLPLQGSLVLTLKKRFYKTKRLTVPLTTGVLKPPMVSLEADFATLDLVSEPSGATVLLDRIPIGTTPTKVARLDAGVHTLHFVLDNYHTEEQTLDLRAGDNIKRMVELRPAFGSLQVKVSPSDAKIFFDDKEVGTGSVELPIVPSGVHSLRVHRQLYLPLVEELELVDGQTIRREHNLEPNFGTLKIGASTLQVDKLLVNGEDWVIAPSYELEVGSYSVVLYPEDARYQPFSTNLELEAREVMELRPVFAPRLGSLLVLSTPAEAQLSLDGTPIGETPHEQAEVLVGKHSLELSKYLYVPVTKDFEIEEGKTLTLELELLERDLVAEAYRRHVLFATVSGYTSLLLAAGSGFFAALALREGWRKDDAFEDYTTALDPAEVTAAAERVEDHRTRANRWWSAAATGGVLTLGAGLFAGYHGYQAFIANEQLQQRRYSLQFLPPGGLALTGVW